MEISVLPTMVAAFLRLSARLTELSLPHIETVSVLQDSLATVLDRMVVFRCLKRVANHHVQTIHVITRVHVCLITMEFIASVLIVSLAPIVTSQSMYALIILVEMVDIVLQCKQLIGMTILSIIQSINYIVSPYIVASVPTNILDPIVNFLVLLVVVNSLPKLVFFRSQLAMGLAMPTM